MMTYYSINFYDDTILDKREYFHFLRNTIGPFIQKIENENEAFKYFFVRYKDEIGPHLRIRMRSVSESYLAEIISGYPQIAVTEYEPEFERYGGKDVIFLSESIFEASSRLTLALIEHSENWSYENSLLFSVAFSAYLINLNAIQQVKPILEDSILFWNEKTLQLDNSSLWEKLENNYHSNEKMITTSFVQAVEIIKNMTNQNDLLFYQQLSHLKSHQVNTVIESLIHMSNNRFGVYNFDEVLTNYYLIKLVNNEQ